MSSAIKHRADFLATCLTDMKEEVLLMNHSVSSLEALVRPLSGACSCGREHRTGLQHLHIGEGAIEHLTSTLRLMKVKTPFVVSDSNTEAAAGRQVKSLLKAAGIDFGECVLQSPPGQMITPDESTTGTLMLAFPSTCDGILSVGAGVITDCCKILSKISGLPQLAVATAPSMDGFASDSASMLRDGIKVTITTPCPVAILCDTEIMATANDDMLKAGLGDMAAKMVSVAEWRISHLVTGEYYCDFVAGLMRSAVKKCMDCAPGLLSRKPGALLAMAEGLVLSGVAMSYAKVSRPASGLEHYFSHVWDMMALDRGTEHALHGLQVGVGTVLSLQLFDWLMEFPHAESLPPSSQKHPDPVSFAKWVGESFGKSALGVLTGVERFGLNDPQARQQRRQIIRDHWEQIHTIMLDELADRKGLLLAMEAAELPLTPLDLGVSQADTATAFIGSRIIRDKYLLSTLLWDLGLTREALNIIVPSEAGKQTGGHI